MTQRIAFRDVNNKLINGLIQTGQFLKESSLDDKLSELVKMRVSQLNGCAFCLDMHYKDAIQAGELEIRLYSLPAWKECPYYSDAERAALAFSEALTNANHCNVEDDLFERLSEQFSPTEIADLTLTIALTNSWNRINKAFRTTPGHYVPGQY